MVTQHTSDSCCSRVYFGDTPVVQPMKRFQERLVCMACAESCITPHSAATYNMLPVSNKRASEDPTAHVCQCVGMHQGGCIFKSRFGEGGDAYSLRMIRASLVEKFRTMLSSQTEALARDACSFAATALVSMMRFHPADVKRAHPRLSVCLDQIEACGPHAPIVEKIGVLVRFMDKNFQLNEYYLYPSSVVDVANLLAGSSLERSMLMLVVAQLTLPRDVVDLRVVFAPETGATVRLSTQYLQFRLPQDRALAPAAAWQWATSPVFEGSHSTKAPTAAQKDKVLFAIRPSGLMEDATANGSADGVLYDAVSFRALILERNIRYLNAPGLHPEEKALLRHELKDVLIDMRDESGNRIRNHHRHLIAIPPRQSTVDFVLDYNTRLAQTTVDNASPAPLRAYPGEVHTVRNFLEHLSTLTAEAAHNGILFTPEAIRACKLLSRCVVFWPAAGREILFLALADMLSNACVHLSTQDVVTLLDHEHLHVFAACEQIAHWGETVQTAFLRMLEVIYSNATDHSAMLGHFSQSVGAVLTSVETISSNRNGGTGWPPVPDFASESSNRKGHTHQRGALDYQLALTLQAVAGSVVIASFADEPDHENIRSITIALVTTLVKVVRSASQALSDTIFSLLDAADAVLTEPLLEHVNVEGISMLIDTLQLAYSYCPLDEIVQLVHRVTGIRSTRMAR